MAGRFPEGQPTEVYVDSREPSTAFLIKRSGNLQVIGIALLGVVIAGLGVRSLVKTVRSE